MVNLLVGHFTHRLASRRTLDALVVSPGGVASTALIEHLSKYVKVNQANDWDGLKHNLDTATNHKLIYVSSRNSDPVRSLDRRGFSRFQLCKIERDLSPLFLGQSQVILRLSEAISLMESEAIRLLETKGEDKVLILSHQNLHKSANKIMDFLDIKSEDFLNRYPIEER